MSSGSNFLLGSVAGFATSETHVSLEMRRSRSANLFAVAEVCDGVGVGKRVKSMNVRLFIVV